MNFLKFSWLVLGVILTSSILTLLPNVSAIQITDCNLVKCSEQQICPYDSILESKFDELLNDYADNIEVEDYDVEANHFDEIPIEALGPVQQSTEKATTTTKNKINSDAAAIPPPLPQEEVEEEDEKEKYEVEESKRRKRELIFTPIPSTTTTPTSTNSSQQIIYQEDKTLKHCCSEYKCVCRLCPEIPQCSINEVAIEVHQGLGTPGQCCSTYKCIRKPQCAENLGFQWHHNSCIKCNCTNGGELCENHCPNDEPKMEDARHKSCFSEELNEQMSHGATWLENKYCSKCSCFNGERSCIINFCAAVECKNPITIKGECCPQCVEVEVEIEEKEVEIEEKEEDKKEKAQVELEIQTKSLKNLTIAAEESTTASSAITMLTNGTVANPLSTLSMEMKTPLTEVAQTNSSDENVLVTFSPDVTASNSVSTFNTNTSTSNKYETTSSTTSETSTLNLEESSTTSPSSMESFATTSNDSIKKADQSTTTGDTKSTNSVSSSTGNSEFSTTTTINTSSSISTPDLESSTSSSTIESSASITTNSSTISTDSTESSEALPGFEISTKFSTTTPETHSTKNTTFSDSTSPKSTTRYVSTSTLLSSSPSSLLLEEEEDSMYTKDFLKLSTQTSSPPSINIFTINSESVVSNTATVTTSKATTLTSSFSSSPSTSAPPPLEPQPTSFHPESESLPFYYADNIFIYLAVPVCVFLTICFGLGIFLIQKSRTKPRTAPDQRKYSTIPSWDTSLSQTSTNTSLTV